MKYSGFMRIYGMFLGNLWNSPDSMEFMGSYGGKQWESMVVSWDLMVDLMGFNWIYPLVNSHITDGKITMLNGKSDCK